MAFFDSDYSGSNDRQYTNGEITVFWKPNKCIHATTCYKELIEVFNPRKRPWVNMNGASTEEIIRIVDLCPTEALTYKYNKNLTEEPPRQTTPETENEVRVMKDGPIIVKGNFKVFGPDGSEYRKMKMVSICRCGGSLQMPFCDGTHRKIGFTGK